MSAPWKNRIVGYGEEAPDQLLANPKNWRTHPASQTDALGDVLRGVGLVQNVIVNQTTGFVVDGHARIALALRDGQPSVPVTYVALDEAEEALILSTLDPLSAMAGTDTAQLDALLREVDTDSPALQAMLAELAEEAGVVSFPELPPDEPVTVDDGPTRCQPGDVWRVGRHLVACLDSTDAEAVRRLVAGRRVGMVWADPPYGIKAVEKNKMFDSRTLSVNTLTSNRDYAPIIGDETTETARRAVALYVPMGGVQVWWGANHYADALPPSPGWLVWNKETVGEFFADAELAWTNDEGAVRMFTHQWHGLIKDSERGEARVHPTQKPIALCAWAFEKYGAPGDLILDPFLGSGPSLKAAEAMGRTVVGFELAPAYVDHILAWGEAQGLTVERAP